MYEDLSKLFANTQSMPALWVTANKLFVGNLEKVVALQMKSLQSYVNLGLSQCKAASEINDIKSLNDFYSGQNEAVKVLRQQVMDDAKALADLGVDMKVGLEDLVKESVTKAAA